MTFDQLKHAAMHAERRLDFRTAARLYAGAARKDVALEQKLDCNTAALRAAIKDIKQTVDMTNDRKRCAGKPVEVAELFVGEFIGGDVQIGTGSESIRITEAQARSLHRRLHGMFCKSGYAS